MQVGRILSTAPNGYNDNICMLVATVRYDRHFVLHGVFDIRIYLYNWWVLQDRIPAFEFNTFFVRILRIYKYNFTGIRFFTFNRWVFVRTRTFVKSPPPKKKRILRRRPLCILFIKDQSEILLQTEHDSRLRFDFRGILGETTTGW